MPVFLPYVALFNAAFSPVASQLVTLDNVTLHNIHFTFFELSLDQARAEEHLRARRAAGDARHACWRW